MTQRANWVSSCATGALPVGTPSRWARPPGGHALPIAADEQAQASYLVCIPSDRTALAPRVLCLGAGCVAVPGLPVATARAPGRWAARCVLLAFPSLARAPVALSCRHGIRAEDAAPAHTQLVLVAAVSVPETIPPAAAGLRLTGGAGRA